MQLIMLCAGRGSRLPKYFRKFPKCMIKINGKMIIEYQQEFISKFKETIFITGYKSSKLKKFIETNNLKEIKNTKFGTTNMVYSMFLAKEKITTDVVVCYGDIFFNKTIYQKLKNNRTTIPIYTEWKSNWIERMGEKATLKDAEDIQIKKNKVISIGGKINKKKLPKYQYMGLIKIIKKDFLKMSNFFKKNKFSKIDMTTFLNACIKQKIVEFDAIKYSDEWFEVDSNKDLKYFETKLLSLKD